MASREERGRYDRWGGGGATRSSASSRNPFDDVPSSRDPYNSSSRYDSGPSAGRYESSSSAGRYDSSSRDPYSSTSRYDSGPSAGRYDSSSSAGRYDSSSRDPYSSTSRYGSRGYEGADDEEGRGYGLPEDDYDMRIQAAYRKMEQSSGNSLRTLNETVRMGVETTEELERQAETLDRVETRLDEIDVDLDKSKRHMRNIRSPFGGISNYFAKRKPVGEVTDPKVPASASSSQSAGRSKKGGQQQQSKSQDSTGNQIVDRNLEEMEKALHQLKGIGELIGDQLDDSDAQITRVGVKMERDHGKMKGINAEIRRELR